MNSLLIFISKAEKKKDNCRELSICSNINFLLGCFVCSSIPAAIPHPPHVVLFYYYFTYFTTNREIACITLNTHSKKIYILAFGFNNICEVHFELEEHLFKLSLWPHKRNLSQDHEGQSHGLSHYVCQIYFKLKCERNGQTKDYSLRKIHDFCPFAKSHSWISRARSNLANLKMPVLVSPLRKLSEQRTRKVTLSQERSTVHEQ